MKKIMIALSLAAMSSVAAAGTTNERADMRVVPAGQGAWVKVLQNGEPVQGATVTLSGASKTYVTSENGIVFVMAGHPSTQTGVFTAKLVEGLEIQKHVVIPRDHD